MTPAYARIIARERGQFDDFIRHPGQEFALVLSGRVRIEFETGEAVSIGRSKPLTSTARWGTSTCRKARMAGMRM
jgi:uncharacterized cupin superfamily protein